MMPRKLQMKGKLRFIKRLKTRDILSGNPLDADNPIRLKGKVMLNKKLGCLSKIKRSVIRKRQDLQEIKNIAEKIEINGKNILFDPVVDKECLWKTLCLSKPHDVKKALLHTITRVLNNEWQIKNSTVNLESSGISNVHDGMKSLFKNFEIKTGAFGKATNQDSYEKRNIVPLPDILEGSTFPPHKLIIHHHNFKR